MTTHGLTIGRLAQSAGVNLETIRYYERIGLMPEPGRTTGGHRSYEPEHRQRLRFIRRSRELGFGIDAIRKLVALSEPDRNSCAEVRLMAAEQVAVIDEKIADLLHLRSVLQQAVGACEIDDPAGCPVLTELFRDR